MRPDTTPPDWLGAGEGFAFIRWHTETREPFAAWEHIVTPFYARYIAWPLMQNTYVHETARAKFAEMLSARAN